MRYQAPTVAAAVPYCFHDGVVSCARIRQSGSSSRPSRPPYAGGPGRAVIHSSADLADHHGVRDSSSGQLSSRPGGRGRWKHLVHRSTQQLHRAPRSGDRQDHRLCYSHARLGPARTHGRPRRKHLVHGPGTRTPGTGESRNREDHGVCASGRREESAHPDLSQRQGLVYGREQR